MTPRVLAVNPGGGSTRVALFHGDTLVHSAEVLHESADLDAVAGDHGGQLELRLSAIAPRLEAWGVAEGPLDAVVGRGGPYRPLPGGVYAVNTALLDDVRQGRLMADHPSKLGAELAWLLARRAQCPRVFVVDPVSVDELWPEARLTGLPELPRVSLFHALNIKAVARRHAQASQRPLEDMVLIVAHLGSGISVALVVGGRAVDVNNSADEGPFSTRRAGGLPATGLLELATQPGFDRQATQRRMMSGGGLLAHLGTADLAAAEARAASGDEHAALVLDAMAYGVAKSIGGLAAVVRGQVDGILLTGGMARCDDWLDRLEEYLRWIADVFRYSGEGEMRALAEGAAAAVRGEVPVRGYPRADSKRGVAGHEPYSKVRNRQAL